MWEVEVSHLYQTLCTGPMSLSFFCLLVRRSFTLPLSIPLSQAPSDDHLPTCLWSQVMDQHLIFSWETFTAPYFPLKLYVPQKAKISSISPQKPQILIFPLFPPSRLVTHVSLTLILSPGDSVWFLSGRPACSPGLAPVVVPPPVRLNISVKARQGKARGHFSRQLGKTLDFFGLQCVLQGSLKIKKDPKPP